MFVRSHLTKAYSSPFVLDKGKLARMTTILEQASAARKGVSHALMIAVKLKTGHSLNFSTLGEVLALDNAIQNPIVALHLTAEFSDASVSVTFDSDRYNNISLNVDAPDKVANDLYAELDEQIERTLSGSWVSRLFKHGFGSTFIVTVTLLAAGLLVSTRSSLPLSEKALLQRANSAHSDHDKIQFLFDKSVRELEAKQLNNEINVRPLFTIRALFISLPLVIIVSVFAYIVVVCYPRAVFAWGDGEQHYNDIVARRRTLSTVVIVTILLGIVSNLFVMSLPILYR